MNENIDPKKLFSAIINASGGNVSKDAIKRAQSGDLNALISALPKEEKQKLLSLLNNKSEAQKILKGKDAQKIINSLKKDKK